MMEIIDSQLKNVKDQYEASAREQENLYRSAIEEERMKFYEATIAAQKAADTKLLNQEEEHKKSAKLAANKAEAKFEIERTALHRDIITIGETFNKQLLNQKGLYEAVAKTTSTAETDASRLATENEWVDPLQEQVQPISHDVTYSKNISCCSEMFSKRH
jgi:hypothetical protein